MLALSAALGSAAGSKRSNAPALNGEPAALHVGLVGRAGTAGTVPTGRAPGVPTGSGCLGCPTLLPAPNDPAYQEPYGELFVQWPLHELEALAAWSQHPGCYFGADDRPQDAPIVAIIDTGVDAGHPDFANAGGEGRAVAAGGQLMLSTARAFISDDPSAPPEDVTDEHGHGTHIAALMAAGTNNGATAGSGIAGLGYPVRLLPLKAAGREGVSTHRDVADALVYAADQGAAIILISFNGAVWSHVLQDAVDYAWSRGCFIVAPAGDAGCGFPSFPAQCPHVFGVASLTASGAVSGYSSQGAHVALSAPGGDAETGVYSALPTYACKLRTDLTTPAYGWLFGTAQAASHVAAAAGLYAGSTGLRPSTGGEGAMIWQALQASAARDGQGAVGWNPTVGYGRLAPALLLAEQPTAPSAPGCIVGRILLAGEPAVGALVTAEPVDGDAGATVEATYPAGAYRIPNLAPGIYRVTACSGSVSGVLDGVAVMAGCDRPGVDFCLGEPEADSEIVAASVPAAGVRGKSVEVSLTFANTGESTWRPSSGYCLEPVASGPLALEGLGRVPLPPGDCVEPGDSTVFTFSLTMPDACGFYTVAWQMCHDGGRGCFGEVARATISVTSFLDVPADSWAVNEIEAAKAAGIVQGYEDDCYHPDWSVSRGQMAAYVARALAEGDSCVPAGPELPSFPDVPTDFWAYDYIEYALDQSIVQGYPEGDYRPGLPLDRAQMAVYIARAIADPTGDEGVLAEISPETPTFPDVSADSWPYRYVEYIATAERGIVRGYDDGLYHPAAVCTRDQLAVYIARAFDLR